MKQTRNIENKRAPVISGNSVKTPSGNTNATSTPNATQTPKEAPKQQQWRASTKTNNQQGGTSIPTESNGNANNAPKNTLAEQALKKSWQLIEEVNEFEKKGNKENGSSMGLVNAHHMDLMQQISVINRIYTMKLEQIAKDSKKGGASGVSSATQSVGQQSLRGGKSLQGIGGNNNSSGAEEPDSNSLDKIIAQNEATLKVQQKEIDDLDVKTREAASKISLEPFLNDEIKRLQREIQVTKQRKSKGASGESDFNTPVRNGGSQKVDDNDYDENDSAAAAANAEYLEIIEEEVRRLDAIREEQEMLLSKNMDVEGEIIAISEQAVFAEDELEKAERDLAAISSNRMNNAGISGENGNNNSTSYAMLEKRVKALKALEITTKNSILANKKAEATSVKKYTDVLESLQTKNEEKNEYVEYFEQAVERAAQELKNRCKLAKLVNATKFAQQFPSDARRVDEEEEEEEQEGIERLTGGISREASHLPTRATAATAGVGQSAAAAYLSNVKAKVLANQKSKTGERAASEDKFAQLKSQAIDNGGDNTPRRIDRLERMRKLKQEEAKEEHDGDVDTDDIGVSSLVGLDDLGKRDQVRGNPARQIGGNTFAHYTVAVAAASAATSITSQTTTVPTTVGTRLLSRNKNSISINKTNNNNNSKSIIDNLSEKETLESKDDREKGEYSKPNQQKLSSAARNGSDVKLNNNQRYFESPSRNKSLKNNLNNQGVNTHSGSGDKRVLSAVVDKIQAKKDQQLASQKKLQPSEHSWQKLSKEEDVVSPIQKSRKKSNSPIQKQSPGSSPSKENEIALQDKQSSPNKSPIRGTAAPVASAAPAESNSNIPSAQSVMQMRVASQTGRIEISNEEVMSTLKGRMALAGTLPRRDREEPPSTKSIGQDKGIAVPGRAQQGSIRSDLERLNNYTMDHSFELPAAGNGLESSSQNVRSSSNPSGGGGNARTIPGSNLTRGDPKNNNNYNNTSPKAGTLTSVHIPAGATKSGIDDLYNDDNAKRTLKRRNKSVINCSGAGVVGSGTVPSEESKLSSQQQQQQQHLPVTRITNDNKDQQAALMDMYGQNKAIGRGAGVRKSEFSALVESITSAKRVASLYSPSSTLNGTSSAAAAAGSQSMNNNNNSNGQISKLDETRNPKYTQRLLGEDTQGSSSNTPFAAGSANKQPYFVASSQQQQPREYRALSVSSNDPMRRSTVNATLLPISQQYFPSIGASSTVGLNPEIEDMYKKHPSIGGAANPPAGARSVLDNRANIDNERGGRVLRRRLNTSLPIQDKYLQPIPRSGMVIGAVAINDAKEGLTTKEAETLEQWKEQDRLDQLEAQLKFQKEFTKTLTKQSFLPGTKESMQRTSPNRVSWQEGSGSVFPGRKNLPHLDGTDLQLNEKYILVPRNDSPGNALRKSRQFENASSTSSSKNMYSQPQQQQQQKQQQRTSPARNTMSSGMKDAAGGIKPPMYFSISRKSTLPDKYTTFTPSRISKYPAPSLSPFRQNSNGNIKGNKSPKNESNDTNDYLKLSDIQKSSRLQEKQRASAQQLKQQLSDDITTQRVQGNKLKTDTSIISNRTQIS